MYKKMIVSMLVAAASLASATTFAAPADNEVRVEASATRVATEDGKTRYWSHPRLGMIKVDAAGRMLLRDQTLGKPNHLAFFLASDRRVCADALWRKRYHSWARSALHGGYVSFEGL